MNDLHGDRQLLSGAQARRCMKSVCEFYLSVANTVLSEAAAGSSSPPDADVVQTETDLSGSVEPLRHSIKTYLSLLLGHIAWHLLNWRKLWHM